MFLNMGCTTNIKPTQKTSNNSQVVGLKLYRKEASVNKALLWFVRCLGGSERKDVTQSGKLSQHVRLISDVEPQRSQQGKETLSR